MSKPNGNGADITSPWVMLDLLEPAIILGAPTKRIVAEYIKTTYKPRSRAREDRIARARYHAVRREYALDKIAKIKRKREQQLLADSNRK